LLHVIFCEKGSYSRKVLSELRGVQSANCQRWPNCHDTNCQFWEGLAMLAIGQLWFMNGDLCV
jgi:hypothetical protein